MALEDIFTSFPFLLVPIIFWTAYKVVQLENKMLGEMKSDLTEMKTDIKWLVEKHRGE